MEMITVLKRKRFEQLQRRSNLVDKVTNFSISLISNKNDVNFLFKISLCEPCGSCVAKCFWLQIILYSRRLAVACRRLQKERKKGRKEIHRKDEGRHRIRFIFPRNGKVLAINGNFKPGQGAPLLASEPHGGENQMFYPFKIVCPCTAKEYWM